MAVATGTAALISAGIGAATQFGGAALASRGNNRALDYEERARREAMQYQRETDWRARMDARQQYDNYMRSVYGDRYQPNRPPVASPTAIPPAGVTVAPSPGIPPAGVVTGPAPGIPPASAPLPSPVVETPPLVAPATEVRTLADLPNWSASNYTRYLGGRR